jgi:allophanate hydrolase
LLEREPNALFPVTRSILARGADISATDTFAGLHQLRTLRHKAYAQLDKVDLLLLPSAGTIYTIEEVNANPIHLNTNLGYYTNFVNLLDLAALAVPGGFKRSVKVPLGVTLIGRAGTEPALLEIGSAMHRALGIGPGVAQQPLAPQEPFSGSSMKTTIEVAVLGAHLSGMPLNHQMTERGAKLVRATRTAPIYRFYALPNTTPPKPGMVRVIDGPGHKIDLEVWEMPVEAYGSFVAGIGAPLGIGTIQLEDGQSVQGFLCESYAVKAAVDISKFGGWKAYVASLAKKDV